MPTKIATVSVCNQVGLDKSIEYSAIAGQACIDLSQIDAAEIGVLLNIGIYRDQNIHEPALASLIQGRIGLNSNLRPAHAEAWGRGTLSFDLLNGVCGFFNAVQLAASFIETRSTRAVLVVASDVHPSCKVQDDFPYTHLGAAALLTRSEDGSGFHDVVCSSSEDDYVGSRSFTDVGKSDRARDELTFEVDEDFSERLAEFALTASAAYIAEHRIDVKTLKGVIVSAPPCDLRPGLTKLLGIASSQIIDTSTRFGQSFTSVPIVGYQIAVEHGLKPGDELLFLSAGAGLTFAGGLYRV
ncbi:MAG TPA: hypothetical protein VK524_32265 [Polyangiaceae bacterium]|nr:hypothetical protein [Polyangiaceae bacterium]